MNKITSWILVVCIALLAGPALGYMLSRPDVPGGPMAVLVIAAIGVIVASFGTEIEG